MGVYEPVENEVALSLLGEGIHTGLRKACDSDAARDAWEAISKMDDWDNALLFFVDGIKTMGYAICKQVEPETAPGSTTTYAVAPQFLGGAGRDRPVYVGEFVPGFMDGEETFDD